MPGVLVFDPGFDLPGAAANWTILDVFLASAATRVDVQFDGLAAVRASQKQAFVHCAYRCTTSTPGTNQLRSVRPAAVLEALERRVA